MRNFVNVMRGEARFRQTVANGAGWKPGAVLLAIESLFGGGSHGRAIDDQGGGGIMPLRDAVLAFFEPGPSSLLKGDGVFEPADSNNVHDAQLAALCLLGNGSTGSQCGFMRRKSSPTSARSISNIGTRSSIAKKAGS